MLLTIHNLPPQMRYADVKALLLSKCGFSEVILDNLVNDGNTKKVTVGLAEEEDAAILTRNINGLYYEGMQLYVRDVRQQRAAAQQPYYKALTNTEQSQSNYQAQMNYQVQLQNQYQAQSGQYGTQQQLQATMISGMQSGMYYMPQMQNSFMGYSGQGQMTEMGQYSQYAGQQSVGGNSREDGDRNRSFEDQSRDNSYSLFYEDRQGDHSSSLDRTQNSRSSKNDRRDRSPRRSGRSRSRSRNRDKSRKNRYQQDERRDSGFNQGPQRFSSGHNNTFTSQTRNEYQGQTLDTSNTSSIHMKLMSLSNNTPNKIIQKPWENIQKSQSGRDRSPHDNNAQVRVWEINPLGNQSQGANNWTKQASYNDNTQGRGRWNNPTTFDNQAQASNNWNRAAPSSSNENQLQSQRNWNLGNISAGNGSQPQSKWGGAAPVGNKTQPFADRAPQPAYSGKAQSQYIWNRSNQPSFDEPQPKRARFDSGNYAPFENQIKQPVQRIWETNSVNSGLNLEPQSQGTGAYPSRNESGKNFQPRTVNPSFNQKNQQKNNQSVPKPAQTGKSDAPAPRPTRDQSLVDTAAVIKKDKTYKFIAAAEIVKQMKANKKLGITTEKMVKNLKRAVRTRLDLLLDEFIGIHFHEMVRRYRRKFRPPTDKDLCVAVSQMEDTPKPGPNGSAPTPVSVAPPPQNSNLKNKGVKTRSQVVASALAPKPQAPATKALPPIQPPADDKLPKYPNADKKVYKAMKALQKDEHKEDNYYREEMVAKHPREEAELIKEADAICNIVKNILQNPDDEDDRKTCNKILNGIIPRLKKAVILNVTKRILDIHTGLTIRIFADGKAPKKAAVEQFLSKYDVVSLKKSEKKKLMYVANLGSFKSYDDLCNMGCYQLDAETMLLFKPFQLAGPRMSVRERKQVVEETRKQTGIIHYEKEGAGNVEGVEEAMDEDAAGEDEDKDLNLTQEGNTGGSHEEELMESVENPSKQDVDGVQAGEDNGGASQDGGNNKGDNQYGDQMNEEYVDDEDPANYEDW